MKTISMTALTLLPAALFAVTSCSTISKSPPAVGSAKLEYKKGVAGGVLYQTFKVTATVTAIDQASRNVTLLATDGKKFTAKAQQKVINFDQFHVGEEVTAILTEKVVVGLDEKATSSGQAAAAVPTRAPDGDHADAQEVETRRMTAEVVAIDPAKHEITLQFEDGSTQAYTRRDVDMTRHKLGEKFVFRVTELDAIAIERTR